MTFISRVNPELPKLFLEQGKIKITDFKGGDYEMKMASAKKENQKYSGIAKKLMYIAGFLFFVAFTQLFMNFLTGGRIAGIFALGVVFTIGMGFTLAISSDAQTQLAKLEDELNIIKHEFQPELMELEKKAAAHRADMAQYDNAKKFSFQREDTL